MRLVRDHAHLLTALAIVLAAGLWARHAVRTPEARDWLFRATGEEDVWEGVKGAAALAWLDVTRPAPDLAPEAPIEHVGVVPYGVNTFLQLEPEDAVVERSLNMLRDAGVRWARQEFPWEDIEIHARGDFVDRRNDVPRDAWEKYDRIVQLANHNRVELLVRLSNPPEWAYADPEAAGDKGPPDDLADFGNFVAEVAGRYCGRVRFYQIWNEPNIFPEWGNRDVDPAGYAELLALAAARARTACADVEIVSAALAPTTEPGGRNMDDLKYLQALYDAGWQDDFDVLAAQAFGLWTGPTDRRASPARANFARPTLVRDVMVANGDADKAVWLTEMGWDSPPEDMAAPYGRVDEARRAVYTRLAYERIAEEWPWVGVAFVWYFRRPDWEWHERPEGYFRLVEPDWTATPSWHVLTALGQAQHVMRWSRNVPDHPAVVYSGPWRDDPLDGPLEQRVGAQDAELNITFHGTGLQLFAAAPPEGTAAPELELIFDVPDAEVTEAQVGDRFAWRVEGLEPVDHLVIGRVAAGELWLDEVVVTPAPRTPLWRPVIVAFARRALGVLVLALLAGLAWRFVGPRVGSALRGARAGPDDAVAGAPDDAAAADGARDA